MFSVVRKKKLMIGKRELQSEILLMQGIAVLLMGVGVVMIYSAQGRIGVESSGFWNSPAGKQIVFAFIGIVLMSIVSRMNTDVLRLKKSIIRWSGLWILLASLAVLLCVYVPGIGLKVNNARRWLKIGAISFQPSEIVKFATVIFLAGLLSSPKFNVRSFFKGLVPVIIVLGVICGIIGREDLGTSALIALVGGLMLIAGGAKYWQMLVPVIPAIGGFVYMIIKKPYRLERIMTFMNIWKDPQGSGYHPIQSLISIADGGWFGKGLGLGIQKYGYLPEDTTDFIFSIICEELGIIGGVLIIGLIVWLMIICWRIYRSAEDDFSRLLIFGLGCIIGLQSAMNIAVATVSIPTKGIALPFVSAGGSGLICFAIAIGIISAVGK